MHKRKQIVDVKPRRPIALRAYSGVARSGVAYSGGEPRCDGVGPEHLGPVHGVPQHAVLQLQQRKQLAANVVVGCGRRFHTARERGSAGGKASTDLAARHSCTGTHVRPQGQQRAGLAHLQAGMDRERVVNVEEEGQAFVVGQAVQVHRLQPIAACRGAPGSW